jgi:hypothetical protein
VAEADAIVELMRQEVEDLRAEYGIPQRGDPLDADSAPSTDALWGYVEDLENALAAQRVMHKMARPLDGR